MSTSKTKSKITITVFLLATIISSILSLQTKTHAQIGGTWGFTNPADGLVVNPLDLKSFMWMGVREDTSYTYIFSFENTTTNWKVNSRSLFMQCGICGIDNPFDLPEGDYIGNLKATDTSGNVMNAPSIRFSVSKQTTHNNTPTPTVSAAQPKVVLVSNKRTGSCQWLPVFHLSGFAPNSSIMVYDHYSYTVCGQTGPNIGDSTAGPFQTDAQGSAEFGIWHNDWGTYNPIFKDSVGNSASLTFSYDETWGNESLNFTDEFVDNRNGWTVGAVDGGTVEIDNGKLVFTSQNYVGVVVPNVLVNNFYVEANVVTILGINEVGFNIGNGQDSTSSHHYIGFTRANSINDIGSTIRVTDRHNDNDKTTTYPSDLLTWQDGVPFKIAIEALNGNYTAYFNDQKVASFQLQPYGKQLGIHGGRGSCCGDNRFYLTRFVIRSSR
jgi:hypothetical protein